MSLATDLKLAEYTADLFSDVAAHTGFKDLAPFFQRLGWTATAINDFYEEEPVLAAGATFVGLAVAIALGPEIAVLSEGAAVIATAIEGIVGADVSGAILARAITNTILTGTLTDLVGSAYERMFEALKEYAVELELPLTSSNSTLNVITSPDITLNIPVTGNLALVGAVNGNGTNAIEIINNTLGTTTFADKLGNPFASYTSSQLSGGSIKVNGDKIEAYNSANQLENSTQELNAGTTTYGVLDKVWSSTTQGVKVLPLSFSSDYLALKDDGTGVMASGGHWYFYQNGALTQINIPGLPNPFSRIFVDNNNEIVVNTSTGSVLYSGASANFTGGTISTLVRQNGQPFGHVGGLSPDGNYVLSAGDPTAHTYLLWNRSAGTYTTIPMPSYTEADGTISYLSVAGINDNGLIVGNFELGFAPSDPSTILNESTVVGGIYNIHNGELTIINEPNAGIVPANPSDPNSHDGTQTRIYGINYAGEVVGTYSKLVDVGVINDPIQGVTYPLGLDYIPQIPLPQTFIYSNGVYSDVNVPSIIPQAIYVNNSPSGQALHVTYSEATGVITENGTVIVHGVAQIDQNGNIVSAGFGSDYVVSTNSTAVTSDFYLENSGSVDLSKSSELVGSIVKLAAGNNNVAFGANANTVNGALGATQYNFDAVFAQDVINNAFGGNSAANGEIDFTSTGITKQNLWLTQSGNDLIVRKLGTSQTITVTGWFGSNAGAKLLGIKTADGLQLTPTRVGTLVAAMASYQSANGGFNPATATSMPSDTTLQSAITNAWLSSANASNITVAYAIANQAALDAGGTYTIADTAANITGGMSFLTSDASHIASITLTDGGTPTLALTAAQYSTGTSALGKITSAYNLSISGIAAANATATAGAAHVTSITVSDTAANFTSNIAALQTLATGTKLASITLMDGGTPAITLTGAQMTADAAALGKIISNYNLTLTGGGTITEPAAITAKTITLHSTTTPYTFTANSTSGLTIVDDGVNDDTINITGGAVNLLSNAYADVFGANNTITGGSNAIIGVYGSNNTVTAGSGDDIWIGSSTSTGIVINGSGNEQYHFDNTFGQDTIHNGGGTVASSNVSFYTGVTKQNLWFKRSGNDLVVTRIGSTNQITITGWYTGNGNQVQSFNAGGLFLSGQINQLVTAMAAYQAAHSTFNPQTATAMPTDTTLQNAITAAWVAGIAPTVSVATAIANQTSLDATAGGYEVVDTAANIVANLSFLLSDISHIGAIQLTDSTTPTLTLTSAQQSADAAVLAKITSPYNLNISGGSSVTAAVAATATSPVAVSDTSANVMTYLPQLQTQAAAGRITSITFTDSTTPTLALTAAQLTADTTVLGTIVSAYNLSISSVTAANASTVAGTAHVTALTVSDTAANIVANIAALQTLATGTKLSSITLTDGTTPTLNLTSAQYAVDSAALGKIGSAYNLSITGVTAANASTTAGAAHVTSITVSDTAANFVTNIAALQTLATGTKLSSITLTDGTTPTLALTAAQYSADGTALGKIGSAYNLSISGVAAASASTIAGASHVTSLTVSDTAANVVTNISALQTLATGTKLSSITLTDGTTPTLALTSAQYSADTAALGKIGSAYNLSISGVTAANAATIAGAAHVTSITVSDTAANFIANIAALQTLAIGTKLSSITLTESTTPTLALTAAQDSANTAALGKIASAYNLTVAGVTAANASSIAGQAHFVSETIADTAANFVANIAALETLAAAGKITSITLTDSTTPTITLTAAQQTADADALNKITSAYNLVITGSTVTASVAATATSAVAVADTAANVMSFLSQLQTQAAAGRITSIAFTDGTTPTLTLSGTQMTADATVLGKITSAYNLALTGGGTRTMPTGVAPSTVTLQSASTPFIFTANSTSGLTIVDNGANGNDTINANAGDIVTIGGNGANGDTVNMTGGTVNLQSNAYTDVVGANNTITVGSNAIIGVYGSNNTITAGNGDDIWIGNSNSTNIVINGGGNENYNFDNTFGQDTINNGGGTLANGHISFYTGVTDENLWFKHVGNDLLVTRIGSTNQIDIAGWYSSTGNQVESFSAGGLTLDTQVAQLVNAMATYQASHSSFNPNTATTMPTDTTLQNAITAAWHS